jgi:hypothetical protein
MNQLNVWIFNLADGSDIMLVSGNLKDRQWMEQETLTGFTPLMNILVEGKVSEAKARVNMEHVVLVEHHRRTFSGENPE